MTELDTRFPADFVWGTATASYQIEGAVNEDGRGESIWDRFCATPSKVKNGDTGAVACDHYHRYGEDVALMRRLDLPAYRFSTSWPRIMPTGTGRVNVAGLDFYDRLVDELLQHGIQPFVTLYHWDLPQRLEDRGGWLVRDTAEAYVDYAEAVVRRLGDRVQSWITHNEPWVASWLGYGKGEHAPGRTDGDRGAVVAAHHLLLSHGLGIEVVRRDALGAQVGITLNLSPMYAGGDREDDVAAAVNQDGRHNRWFLDPVFRGTYPSDIDDLVAHLPPDYQIDMPSIGRPIDFLGVNYYYPGRYRAGQDGSAVEAPLNGAPRTEMGWEVYPDGLHDLLVRLHRDYAPSRMYITENGAAYADAVGPDGRIRDDDRRRYVEDHLEAAGRAIEAGVPLAGYFLWSLMDNFEWAHGYSKRFGIVYVDYPTQTRIPKQSAEWYSRFIQDQMSGR